MKAAALLYHDVVEGDNFDASGLPGAGAAVYKLDVATFERHLDALGDMGTSPVRVIDRVSAGSRCPSWMLTFDDGGASATVVADLLARRGWRGHFFITGDRIGERGFVSAADIRDLDAAGHVVGSHSWSHPPRISALARDDMIEEWVRSVARLSSILGHPVESASVPGGFYAPNVARAAELAEIRWLFTSEPVLRPWNVGSCLVLGRFSVQRDTEISVAAALAAGRLGPRARLWLAWNARKAMKRAGGSVYERSREMLLRRRYPTTRDRPSDTR